QREGLLRGAHAHCGPATGDGVEARLRLTSYSSLPDDYSPAEAGALTMRAARLHELGGAPVVDEVDAPEGSNVVAVSAAALTPVDIAIGNGRFYGGSPETPYVIGSEAVGTAPDGRRVWFRTNAAVAEQAVASPGQTYDVPDGVDDANALACGIAGVTGWLAVAWRAKVTPDDTVLVLGASGTVG